MNEWQHTIPNPKRPRTESSPTNSGNQIRSSNDQHSTLNQRMNSPNTEQDFEELRPIWEWSLDTPQASFHSTEIASQMHVNLF